MKYSISCIALLRKISTGMLENENYVMEMVSTEEQGSAGECVLYLNKYLDMLKCKVQICTKEANVRL